MSMSFIEMTLSELRQSRAPKYDVMFKMVFSLGSSLRDMLLIPKGLALSEEFPDLDGLRIDSLTLFEDLLYHLEFQAKNHATMARRMFTYRAKIMDRPDIVLLQERYRIHLRQQVLYVGSGPMAMASELQRSGEVVYSFGLNDIREFEEEKHRLATSRDPEDWVLSLLVANDEKNDDQRWLNVAERMRCELDAADPETAEYRTVLLIASVLRELGWSVQEKISEMIQIDVSGNRLLRQVFEQGMQEGYQLLEVDRIRRYISRNKLTVDPSILEELGRLTPEEMFEFAEEFDDAIDKQAFFENRAPSP